MSLHSYILHRKPDSLCLSCTGMYTGIITRIPMTPVRLKARSLVFLLLPEQETLLLYRLHSFLSGSSHMLVSTPCVLVTKCPVIFYDSSQQLVLQNDFVNNFCTAQQRVNPRASLFRVHTEVRCLIFSYISELAFANF